MPKNPTMTEEFSLVGRWWLPNRPDDNVRGTVTFVPGKEIRLDTFGRLSIDNERLLPSSGQKLPVILGETQHHKPVTLLSCFPRGGNYGALEFATESIHARYFVVGTHITGEKECAFDRFVVGFTLLDDWLNLKPIHQENYFDPDAGPPSASYKSPEHLQFNIPEEDLTLDTEYTLNRDGVIRKRQLNWTHSTHLSVRPSESQSLEWITNHLWKLRRLFTLLADDKVVSTKVEGFLPGSAEDSQEKAVDIYLTEYGVAEAKKEKKPRRMIAPLYIFDDIEKAFQRWYAFYDQYQAVIDLFHTTVYEQDLPIRFDFIAFVQALAIYAQKSFNDRHMDQEEFDAFVAEALQHLPEDTDDDIKEDISSRMRRMNTPTFASYLTKILVRSGEETIAGLGIDMDSFVDEVSLTRRHIVEKFTGRPNGEGPTGEQILRLSAYLHRIFLNIILEELGMSQEQRLDAVPDSVGIPKFIS